MSWQRVGWWILSFSCAACSNDLTGDQAGGPSGGGGSGGTDSAGTSSGGQSTGGGAGTTGGAGGTTGGAGGTTGGSGGTTGGQPSACVMGMIAPGRSPVRRLNRFEYNNTIADLLQDQSSPANTFPLEEQALGFDNNADVLRASQLLVEAYIGAAQRLATNLVSALPTRLPCAATAASAAATAQEQCVGELIDDLAPRAFRRPLAAEERERLLGTFRAGRVFLDFGSSVGAVVEQILLSPQFLYRIENGAPVDGNPGVLKVDGWGLASRLSYFLWASMPDAELMTAAAEGRLTTAADVQAQAERMYGLPRSRAVVKHFVRSWLDIGHVDGQRKDPALFPDYTPEIGTLLRVSTETFAEHLFFDGGGTLTEMLTAPYTYMNGPLARFMGVTGPTGDAFEKVELDPAHHSGVLTDASIMSANATANRTHPIFRGVFVRGQILCDPPQPPPPGIIDMRDDVTDPNATERDRLAVHREDITCAGCHDLIDPVGLAFENFDAMGRWRDMEGTRPVDASGGLPETDVDGTVNGAIELTQKLAESEQVKRCLGVHWFRYANGRGESMDDACSVERVNTAFAQSGGNLRDLVLSLTQTDAFLYRKAAP